MTSVCFGASIYFTSLQGLFKVPPCVFVFAQSQKAVKNKMSILGKARLTGQKESQASQSVVS